MDLLKRHWEKILLTISLLLLLAAAVLLLLKIGAMREEVQGLTGRFRHGSDITTLNVRPYEAAIEHLKKPVLWAEMPVDPFRETRVEIVAASTNTNTVVVIHDRTTITLLRVDQIPFTMMFVAYVGNGRNFQLNLQFRPRTFFVEKAGDRVEDQYSKTGYVVTNFVKKTAQVHNESLGSLVTVDVSELTLEHPGEKPIVLVLNKPAVHGEPVATIACSRRGQTIGTTQVRRGQRFHCGQTSYNVVDIKPDEMLIVDEQKPEEKPVAIKLKSAMPVNEEEGVPDGLGEPGDQNH